MYNVKWIWITLAFLYVLIALTGFGWVTVNVLQSDTYENVYFFGWSVMYGCMAVSKSMQMATLVFHLNELAVHYVW